MDVLVLAKVLRVRTIMLCSVATGVALLASLKLATPYLPSQLRHALGCLPELVSGSVLVVGGATAASAAERCSPRRLGRWVTAVVVVQGLTCWLVLVLLRDLLDLGRPDTARNLGIVCAAAGVLSVAGRWIAGASMLGMFAVLTEAKPGWLDPTLSDQMNKTSSALLLVAGLSLSGALMSQRRRPAEIVRRLAPHVWDTAEEV